MNWSPGQESALREVNNWLRSKHSQLFRLFGYAGTGKTTIARQIADDHGGRVAFAAFTGKAAHVLRQKGCNATTIHRLIYVPAEKSRARLRELQELLAKTDPLDLEKVEAIKLDIKTEENNLRRPMFTLNLDSELRHVDLVVVDECSMVDERIGTDLLSFGVPVLVLGDPAQLPPVQGGGFFTNGAPDVMLTEIHRQARGNPIIELATRVREGLPLPLGDYGDSQVISGKPEPSLVLSADQIIVGRNATRTFVNGRCRELLARDGQGSLPIAGDKLVCLRNDHEVGLLNGSLWDVAEAMTIDEESMQLTVKGDDGVTLDCEAHTHYFQGRGDELPWWRKRESQEFDYGYALTCHKAQGSQWGHVFIFDESRAFRQHAKNWLYTAITRASERVTVVRN